MGFDGGKWWPKKTIFILIFEDELRMFYREFLIHLHYRMTLKSWKICDFCRLGLLTAFSLVYGCPSPKDFSKILVHEILNLPPTTGIADIAGYEIQLTSN